MHEVGLTWAEDLEFPGRFERDTLGVVRLIASVVYGPFKMLSDRFFNHF